MLMVMTTVLYAVAAGQLYYIQGSNLRHKIFIVLHKCYSATKEFKTEAWLMAEYIYTVNL